MISASSRCWQSKVANSLIQVPLIANRHCSRLSTIRHWRMLIFSHKSWVLQQKPHHKAIRRNFQCKRWTSFAWMKRKRSKWRIGLQPICLNSQVLNTLPHRKVRATWVPWQLKAPQPISKVKTTSQRCWLSAIKVRNVRTPWRLIAPRPSRRLKTKSQRCWLSAIKSRNSIAPCRRLIAPRPSRRLKTKSQRCWFSAKKVRNSQNSRRLKRL